MAGCIAPHMGLELELVLSGKKPLGSYNFETQARNYTRVVNHHLGYRAANAPIEPHISIRYVGNPFQSGDVVFALKGNAHLLENYVWLRVYGVQTYGLHLYHTLMGKLYGYSDADIEAFIKSEISTNCNCKICKGTV